MRNFLLFVLTIILLISACKKDDPPTALDVSLNSGVFIVNQGTLTASNASLSFFDNSANNLYNGLFYAVNLTQLGDVAQSISIYNDIAFVVVSNSGVIYAIDAKSAKLKGTISNLVSPRYMMVINDQKAYVSDLYSMDLAIVNPTTYEVTGSIPLGRTSEEMVIIGKEVFVANWSDFNQGSIVNNRILVVDSEIDSVTANIKVGIEPNSLVVDKNDNLWVLCTGGYNHVENPSLWKIDGNAHIVVDSIIFNELYSFPSNLEINGSGDTLFYLNNGIFKMPIDAATMPTDPFIKESAGREFTFLGVDPVNSDIYASNPLNNLTDGIVYRYNKKGYYLSQMKTGIVPAAFGFSY